jgi:hypothetical protein
MDHLRTLGTLFIAWAATQLVAVVLALTGRLPSTAAGPLGKVALVTTLLAVVAYGWFGVLLRRHDPRVRMGAILLSVLALLAFPVGTIIGAYGLFVLLRKQQVVA